MCTLIIGRHVLGPGTLILAGNRDEDPERPSELPAIISRVPRVAAGRDAVAGGTWMAVRERRAAVAMLNRRGPAPPARATLCSRGQFTLDLAGVGEDYVPRTTPRTSLISPSSALGRAALRKAWDALDASRFAPFSAVFASPESCFVFAHPGGSRPPRVRSVSAGWHALTHEDLDDPKEPRTAALLRGLADWKPQDYSDAERGLMARLSSHGQNGGPAVCIHDDPMATVSSFVVWLAPGEARYMHLEGRPCEAALEDYSHLLEGATVTLESP